MNTSSEHEYKREPEGSFDYNREEVIEVKPSISKFEKNSAFNRTQKVAVPSPEMKEIQKQQTEKAMKLNNTQQAQGSQTKLFDQGDNRVKLDDNESENNAALASDNAKAKKQTRF